MSSAVAAFLHAIHTRVKIVPREKSGTKPFAWTDFRNSSTMLSSLDSSTEYVKINFFHRAVPEKRNVKYVSKIHEN